MKEEILKFFKGDVEDSAETLEKYSRDASVFRVQPALVLFPKDEEDVKNLVRWAGEWKEVNEHPGNPNVYVSITARCAGTDMSGGAIGESIILDFTRYMNRLIGGPLPLRSNKEWTITVEPGMFYRDFEKITLAKGLILPCYTASKNINAIGGMFGNNSAGERTLKYGQTEKYVLSSRVVFADGNVYEVKPLTRVELNKKMAQGDFEGNLYKQIFELIRAHGDEIKHAKPNVHKNSAGYYLWNVIEGDYNSADFRFDLNKLLVGSQGTLGIATEITLKLLPEEKYRKLAVISTSDLDPLGRLIDEILTENPETLETYDDKTMRLAVKFFPDFLRHKDFRSAMHFLRSFVPEVLTMFSRGFPKLVILAEFAGENESELQKKFERLGVKLKNFKVEMKITSSELEASKYWNIRRESFALLRKHVRSMRTAPFIDDIIVRPEFLPKFLPELNKILFEYRDRVIYTLAGHAGDGNFHIIPLMDFKRSDTAQTILELGQKVFELTLRFHGSLAAEHNDGLIRTPYLRLMYGEILIRLFRKTKEIFDPKNIFNPGKKVPAGRLGGTLEYISAHIAEEHHAVHKA